MRYNILSFLKSPKKEEQEVPDTTITTTTATPLFSNSTVTNEEEGELLDDAMVELEEILGIEDDDDENLSKDNTNTVFGHLSNWDLIDSWEDRPNGSTEEDDVDEVENYCKTFDDRSNFFEEDEVYYNHHSSNTDMVVKSESNDNYVGFWDGTDEKNASLNLNLNYQEVLDAWSDRGTPWADDCSLSMASTGDYVGEVPVMEEERTSRREASVLRYKEKRQTRLFSKKIRYQVRKLNADKRPRLKGRFVKRLS